VAGIQGKVFKQGKRNGLHRFIVAKGDKDKIVAWKQDLVRVLHVFNVRSIGLSTIRKLNILVPDRASDRYPHGGGKYPHNGCGNSSKGFDGTGWGLQPRALGRCDWLSIINSTLTIT
jgi:hypothetical protein